MAMKNSNETIGNRTRDLPACNAVPQAKESVFLLVFLCENNQHRNVRVGVLKVVLMKNEVFDGVTPCRTVNSNPHFEGT